jgi:pimeloyl-ACP methyl ester carboxylesterase/SAM-dependent methyltransferase
MVERPSPPALPPPIAAALGGRRSSVPVSLEGGGTLDLHVVEDGDPRGRPVLFVHGNRSWSITWRRVMPLAGGHRLVAVDLPGFGRSDPLPAGRRTLAGHGAAIRALLESLGIADAVFVAHEAGGLVVHEAARGAPGLFAGGVLVGSAMLPVGAQTPPTLHRFGRAPRLRDLAFAAGGRPRLALDALQTRRAEFASSSAALYAWPLDRVRRRSMLELAALAAEPAARVAAAEWLLDFPGPLALVWGHRDPLLRPEDFAAQERELPYARIWRTEAGHFVQEEEPAQVAEAIAWAVANVGRAPDAGVPDNFLPGIGVGEFEQVGRDQVRRLAELAGLDADDRVLDVGCGLGRTALALGEVLSARGRYHGLDVVREVVRWCQQNLTRVDPRLRFHHAPVRSDLYNPSGTLAARDYRFPFETGSFDFAIAESLFTHLEAEDARRYLVEIARVLRAGGTLWASAFLLDAGARQAIAAGRSDRRFAHARGGAWVDDAERPLAAVAFDLDRFVADLRAAGLEPVAPPLLGAWRGGAGGGYQDVVVVKKRSA